MAQTEWGAKRLQRTFQFNPPQKHDTPALNPEGRIVNEMIIDRVDAARKRIAELQEVIEQLQEFVGTWERVSHLLSTPLKDLPMPLQPDSTPVDKSAPPVISGVRSDVPMPARRTRVTDNPKPAVVLQHAVEILREHGRPMSRRELHEALAARNIIVRGSDPVKALGTMLWRGRDQLVQLDGFGYWPKADPYPPARYNGDLHDLLGPLVPGTQSSYD